MCIEDSGTTASAGTKAATGAGGAALRATRSGAAASATPGSAAFAASFLGGMANKKRVDATRRVYRYYGDSRLRLRKKADSYPHLTLPTKTNDQL